MEGKILTGGRCPLCGGVEVAAGLIVNQSTEVLRIGLAYKAGGFMTACEPLRADLCQNCGSVVRLFVKEPKRNWLQK